MVWPIMSWAPQALSYGGGEGKSKRCRHSFGARFIPKTKTTAPMSASSIRLSQEFVKPGYDGMCEKEVGTATGDLPASVFQKEIKEELCGTFSKPPWRPT